MITGDSFNGGYIPLFADYIRRQDNTDLNLAGLAIGNGWVDPFYQFPAYNIYAYDNNLIGYGHSVVLSGISSLC